LALPLFVVWQAWRITFGSYPALSLKDARPLRDEARSLLAKGVNPHSERKRDRHAIVLAG
jgi:hypothetical protein